MTVAQLLRALSWPELRRHPWRHATALAAVVLGVALAFAVHLINASALAEFGAALRSVNGEPDFELRAAWRGAGFDEALYARVAAHPQVALASPVLEVDTVALDAQGRRVALRVLGADMLVAPLLAPELMPQLRAGEARLAFLDPGALFLNAAALDALDPKMAQAGAPLRLLAGSGSVTLRVAGTVPAPGPPLALLDIAGAQAAFGLVGRLTRISVRLAPGADREAVLRGLALPAGVRAAAPDEAAQRMSNVSRAYRVNLTVLAFVALFTGAFLVYSVLALSVAQRMPQFALLGVLGLTARERMRLVLAESALLGLTGSLLGLALGTGLAALALRWLAGDLGAGFFAPGGTPLLRFDAGVALAYGVVGVLAALAGGWLPARAAEHIAPAQALKGLAGTLGTPARLHWLGPALLLAGGLLALCPPVFGLPLAAYLAVACLLLGGIACVPALIGLLLAAVAPPRSALPLLAVERVRRRRESATIAVAGVVASLALSVALTVMVASFRDSMTRWLDRVLPADLYVRGAPSLAAGDSVFLAPPFVAEAHRLPGIARAAAQRTTQVQLATGRPTVALIARPLADPAQALPLVGELHPAADGRVAVYVSEAMVDLYGARPGAVLELPLPDGSIATLQVRGVWRDYARQGGAIVLDAADYHRLTGDARVNDLALWLAPGADPGSVQAALQALAGDMPLEFALPGEIRALSLRIFDRSFAVTLWLQAVAIGIGLFGVGASFSAQVLARRREFALLTHLGLTRRQIVAIVAAEGALWTLAGALLGLVLGLAVSVVLVEVVNPQSFHWTMDLALPGVRLAALCGAVVAAGTFAAWLAARALARQDMALAVKEDW